MGQGNLPEFGISKNVKQIGRTDLAGGGQVVVENGYAFVGHMDPPQGTTILDVKDPKHPKVIAHVEIPQGVHSHKVRVSGDIMLVNLEKYRSKEKLPTGLKIYDISNLTDWRFSKAKSDNDDSRKGAKGAKAKLNSETLNPKFVTIGRQKTKNSKPVRFEFWLSVLAIAVGFGSRASDFGF